MEKMLRDRISVLQTYFPTLFDEIITAKTFTLCVQAKRRNTGLGVGWSSGPGDRGHVRSILGHLQLLTRETLWIVDI
jgi:hypothetical protein